MNELPKELTPELLGLVLNSNILIEFGIEFKGGKTIGKLDYVLFPSIYFWYNNGNGDRCLDVTLDTLTRLMKEWCITKEFIISSCINGSDIFNEGIGFAQLQDFEYEYDCDYLQYKGQTEFEAVLKATHWVAKEKGLLSV